MDLDSSIEVEAGLHKQDVNEHPKKEPSSTRTGTAAICWCRSLFMLGSDTTTGLMGET